MPESHSRCTGSRSERNFLPSLRGKHQAADATEDYASNRTPYSGENKAQGAVLFASVATHYIAEPEETAEQRSVLRSALETQPKVSPMRDLELRKKPDGYRQRRRRSGVNREAVSCLMYQISSQVEDLQVRS